MSKRLVSCVCVLGLTLAACPKKEDATADAGAMAVIEAAAPVAVTPADAVDAGPATAVGALPVVPGARVVPKGADGGAAADAGSVIVDAGAIAVVDAGAGVQTCCCSVPGQATPSQVAQSECTKTLKGQCVKKEQCSAAPAPVPVPVVDAGAAAQKCCCEINGVKALRSQSDCTKGGAGKCVKLTECPK